MGWGKKNKTEKTTDQLPKELQNLLSNSGVSYQNGGELELYEYMIRAAKNGSLITAKFHWYWNTDLNQSKMMEQVVCGLKVIIDPFNTEAAGKLNIAGWEAVYMYLSKKDYPLLKKLYDIYQEQISTAINIIHSDSSFNAFCQKNDAWTEDMLGVKISLGESGFAKDFSKYKSHLKEEALEKKPDELVNGALTEEEAFKLALEESKAEEIEDAEHQRTLQKEEQSWITEGYYNAPEPKKVDIEILQGQLEKLGFKFYHTEDTINITGGIHFLNNYAGNAKIESLKYSSPKLPILAEVTEAVFFQKPLDQKYLSVQKCHLLLQILERNKEGEKFSVHKHKPYISSVLNALQSKTGYIVEFEEGGLFAKNELGVPEKLGNKALDVLSKNTGLGKVLFLENSMNEILTSIFDQSASPKGLNEEAFADMLNQLENKKIKLEEFIEFVKAESKKPTWTKDSFAEKLIDSHPEVNNSDVQLFLNKFLKNPVIMGEIGNSSEYSNIDNPYHE